MIRLLPTKLTDLIRQLTDLCNENHEVFRKYGEALDPNKAIDGVLRTSDLVDSTIFRVLGTTYRIMGILSDAINKVGTSIERLPDRGEFDMVKDELQSGSGFINDAVIPIKKSFEDARDRELRGEDVYE
jgi:hypothetical protein